MNSIGAVRTYEKEKVTLYITQIQINARYPSLSISLSVFWLYLYFSLPVSLSLVELVHCSFTFWLSFSMFHPHVFLSFTLPLVSTQACGKTSFCEKAQIRAFKHPSACESTSWVSPMSQIFHILYVDEYMNIIKLLSAFCLVQHTYKEISKLRKTTSRVKTNRNILYWILLESIIFVQL